MSLEEEGEQEKKSNLSDSTNTLREDQNEEANINSEKLVIKTDSVTLMAKMENQEMN